MVDSRTSFTMDNCTVQSVVTKTGSSSKIPFPPSRYPRTTILGDPNDLWSSGPSTTRYHFIGHLLSRLQGPTLSYSMYIHNIVTDYIPRHRKFDLMYLSSWFPTFMLNRESGNEGPLNKHSKL